MSKDLMCPQCGQDLNLPPDVHAQLARLTAAQERVRVLEEALEKIADPRKRDHKEPDAYTELGCVMSIAEAALAGEDRP